MPERRSGRSVYHGSYKTRAGAKRVASTLKRKGKPGVFIRKYKGKFDVRYA
jgi:hypothetical protein